MAKSSFTLTADDRARISAAVTAAEAHTSGEITTIMAADSDSYHDVALVWSALVAFAALAALSLAPAFYLGLVDRMLGQWGTRWPPQSLFALAASVAIQKFTAMWLILRWRPLRLALVPGAIKHARVRARALACFRIATDQRTRAATGLLIYLSLAERRAEIVAEHAIAAKVAPELWGEAMATMLIDLGQGRVADGMIAAIGQTGRLLADHFPRQPNDSNELPDRLIEI